MVKLHQVVKFKFENKIVSKIYILSNNQRNRVRHNTIINKSKKENTTQVYIRNMHRKNTKRLSTKYQTYIFDKNKPDSLDTGSVEQGNF